MAGKKETRVTSQQESPPNNQEKKRNKGKEEGSKKKKIPTVEKNASHASNENWQKSAKRWAGKGQVRGSAKRRT